MTNKTRILAREEIKQQVELDWIRAKLIKAEESGFTDKTKEQILKMKTHTLEKLTNKFVGKKGTANRNAFENELKLDLIEQKTKAVRNNKKPKF